MRTTLSIAAIATCLIGSSTYSQTQSEDNLPKLLSNAEAEAIIKDRRAQREASEEAYRKQALDQTAIEERTLVKGKQKILFRKVEALPQLKASVQDTADESSATSNSGTANFELIAEYRHENISLGANVYGDKYSEVTWRDTETGKTVTVWTNFSLNYLKPIVSFSSGDVHYDYFGFVTNYTLEGEETRIQVAKEHGYDAESRWKYPPVSLSDNTNEYYIEAPWDTEIPDKLYRQLDALFGYYLEHEERFRIEYLNAKALHAAYKADLKANPPKEPKEVIMNYTPLRGEDAQ